MKAGILERVGHLVVREVPDPALEKGSMLIRVRVCCICATDLRIYQQGDPRVKLPHILGHEITGVIESVGDGVRSHRVGERVAITPRIACGECFYCRRGQSVYCEKSLSFGYQLPGGYAQYLAVPWHGLEFGVVNTIPDALSFEEAALAEPLSCCLRAQRALRVSPADAVVVIGGGPVGIMHCRLARANKAGRVILVEKDAARLRQVKSGPADLVIDPTESDATAEILALTGGRGADLVIVACSSAEAQEQSLAFAGRGGRINFFGGLAPGQSSISIDSNVIHYREVSVQGSHGSTPADNREALDLLAAGVVKVSDLITHRFPLDSIGEAFLFAESRKGMHIAIIP